jgi:periplasmic glucans biosynthesis protein
MRKNVGLVSFLSLTISMLLWLPLVKGPAMAQEGVTTVFGFENVVHEAKELSALPYVDHKGVPESLLKIKYDQWRDIRFKPPKSFWRQEGLPFTLQFFHPGLFYDRVVGLFVVDQERVAPLSFSKEYFDYKSEEVKALVPDDLGFAGFRIHYPLNRPNYHDEIAVFLGASYFRAVGQKMNYGLSARGLAIDTALPSGEEFPIFKKFWIVRPATDAKDLTFYALLDSPSVTGAYRFIISPGKENIMQVRLTLFLRKPVAKLGIAPLTSMFHHGESTVDRVLDDFRPEIHDSDGLMIATGSGEWIWRPLLNSKTLFVNSFQDRNPKGFGLIQRDMEFDHYQDLESNYQNRPSLWISPLGPWGEGRVELVQIPTDKEIFDNMVAYWVPSKPPPLGDPISLAYEMAWHYASDSPCPPGGRVISTRAGKNKMENAKFPDARLFVIDFAGGKLGSLDADEPVEGVVSVGRGARVVEQQVVKNTFTGGWRLAIHVLMDEQKAKRREPVELRAFLRHEKDVLTETWSYVYEP